MSTIHETLKLNLILQQQGNVGFIRYKSYLTDLSFIRTCFYSIRTQIVICKIVGLTNFLRKFGLRKIRYIRHTRYIRYIRYIG